MRDAEFPQIDGETPGLLRQKETCGKAGWRAWVGEEPSQGGASSAAAEPMATGGGFLRAPPSPQPGGAAKPMRAAASAASQLPRSSSAIVGGAVGVWMKFFTTASAWRIRRSDHRCLYIDFLQQSVGELNAPH